MLKIKLVSNYASSERLVSEVLRQFAPNDFDTKQHGFEFVYGYDYDRLVIFNYTNEKIFTAKEHTYGIAQEPSWSENYKDLSDITNVFIAPVNQKCVLPFLGISLSYDEILKTNFEKSKQTSFVVSRQKPIAGTLYDFRTKLVEAIIESDLPIDIYGAGWEYLQMDKRIKGRIEKKEDGLKDYHSSIYVENTQEDFYVTEKFWDMIAVETLPIPLGPLHDRPMEETLEVIKSFMELFNTPDSRRLSYKYKQELYKDENILQFILDIAEQTI